MAKLKKKTVEYYSFYCPGCKHLHVYVVADDNSQWSFNGGIDKPTFTPSLLNKIPVKNEITGIYDSEKERCHLNITNGMIYFHPDCMHELADKTVEMTEF